MNRSTKIRYIIFQILIEIFKKNKNFNIVFDEKIAEHSFNQNELSFIKLNAAFTPPPRCLLWQRHLCRIVRQRPASGVPWI